MSTETAFATPAAQSTLYLTNLCLLSRLRTTVLNWSYSIDSGVWMARKANKMHPQTEKSVRNVKLTPRGQRWPKFISQSIEPAFSKYWIRHIEPDILIRIWFPQKNSFWISVSGWKLTIRPDNHPANRIVIVSAGKCAKLHSVATSKNRDHMLCAYFFLLVCGIYTPLIRSTGVGSGRILFLFCMTQIRTRSSKFVKNRIRSRSHFSPSAVAGVCVVIS